MGEVVNLRMQRKAAARREREAAADANRTVHGRSKAERATIATERARAERTLDGARREPE